MPETPKTVLIADDHAVVREGLRLVLERHEDLHVVAEAANIEETIRKTLGHKPDVLVLDLNMPDGSTLDVLDKIRAASPDTAIVVLTMQSEPGYARTALQRGVEGYVLKESAAQELRQAIDTVLKGGTFLSPSLGARLASAPEPEALPDGITPREAEVLGLLAVGHTNAEIADKLHLSRRTVESHRSHLQTKTGADTRSALVRYAINHGLARLEVAES